MYVTVVEAVKIQSYVFGSNRLRENIGASYLVWAATERWPFEVLKESQISHNVKGSGNSYSIDPNEKIEQNQQLDAEVVYAGGGNFLVLFRSEDLARDFTTALSKRALEQAPGLRLLAATQKFEWDDPNCWLRNAVKAAFEKLERMKQQPERSVPLLGLGVTMPCGSTGLPATDWVDLPDGTKQPASAEVAAKDAAADMAEDRLKREVPLPKEYLFPREFDNLGRARGEFSYIAVGHADGDSMGETIQVVGEQAKSNREYVDKLRALSGALSQSGQEAFSATLEALLDRIKVGKSGNCVIREEANGELVTEVELVPVQKKKDRWFLPFRPLIFGGDDFTFVSDGRLGLALLIKFMKAFKEAAQAKKNAFGGRTVTASGGVAIVKAHYPFARAYSLAEQLCHSAKKFRHELKSRSLGKQEEQELPCLDWHFAQAGLLGSIGEIRERHFRVSLKNGNRGRLELRPVSLGDGRIHDARDWSTVRKGIDEFRAEEWFGRRNKMKALIEALRGGEETVKQFRHLYNEGRLLPDIFPDYTGWPREGWQGGECGYYDALELVDWYVSL